MVTVFSSMHRMLHGSRRRTPRLSSSASALVGRSLLCRACGTSPACLQALMEATTQAGGSERGPNFVVQRRRIRKGGRGCAGETLDGCRFALGCSAGGRVVLSDQGAEITRSFCQRILLRLVRACKGPECKCWPQRRSNTSRRAPDDCMLAMRQMLAITCHPA